MRTSQRWSARLGGAAFVLLAAAVCIVAPASAATPGGIGLVPTTVRISPSSGPAGTPVTVRGTGFDPGICGGRAGVRWRGAGFLAVQHVPLRDDGTFTATVRAPSRGLLGTRSARLVTSCGPGAIGLPGPRAWFRISPAAAERPQPATPTAAPTTQPAPTTRPAPRPDRPTTQPESRPTGEPTRDGGAGGSGGGGGGGAGGAGQGGPGASGGRDGAGSVAGGSDGSAVSPGSAGSNGSDGATDPAEILAPPVPSPATGVTTGVTASPTTGPTTGASASGASAPGATPSGATAVAAAGGSAVGVEAVRPALVTATVPTPQEVRFDPELIALAAALAVLFVVLVAFPAELFNSTYDANAGEIRALLGHPVRRLRRAVVAAGATPAQARTGTRNAGLVLAGFVAVSTLLTVVLAGNEAANGNWPAQILGLLAAITVVTLVAELPEELSARRYSGGMSGRLQVLPVAVLVAVACTLLSRILGLEPAYMYGLFAGFATVAVRPLTVPQEGRAVLAGIGTVAAFGLVCWLVWGRVHEAAYDGSAGWPTVLLDAVLFWCFVLATEGLVFALIPLSFLDGATLRAWNPLAWLLPQIAAAVFFVYVFVLQGGTGDVSSGAVLRAAIFFAVFGLLSVAFWAYFRWEGRPSHAMESDLARNA